MKTRLIEIGGKDFDITFTIYEGDQEIPHLGDGTGQQGSADEMDIVKIEYYGEDFYEFFRENNLMEKVAEAVWETLK